MAGTQGERKGSLFRHNEFILVSSFMLLILPFIVVAESGDVDPPSWVYKLNFLREYIPDSGEGSDGEPVETQRTVLDMDGTTLEGASTTVPLSVNGSQTLNLTIQLTWSDDFGNNDVFEVSISGSSGELAKGTGDQGNAEISVNATGGADGKDQGDLRGDYNITIKAVSCPGMFESNPFDLDGGNDWTLKVTAIMLETPEE